jgi:hypothetical protein
VDLIGRASAVAWFAGLCVAFVASAAQVIGFGVLVSALGVPFVCVLVHHLLEFAHVSSTD